MCIWFSYMVKQQLHIDLPAKLVEMLDIKAKETTLPRTAVLRLAIINYCEGKK